MNLQNATKRSGNEVTGEQEKYWRLTQQLLATDTSPGTEAAEAKLAAPRKRTMIWGMMNFILSEVYVFDGRV